MFNEEGDWIDDYSGIDDYENWWDMGGPDGGEPGLGGLPGGDDWGNPIDWGGPENIPDDFYYDPFSGMTYDSEGNPMQFSDEYGWIPGAWGEIPDDFSYGNDGSVYDSDGNPVTLTDDGWIPNAWIDPETGKFSEDLYKSATGASQVQRGPGGGIVNPKTGKETSKKKEGADSGGSLGGGSGKGGGAAPGGGGGVSGSPPKQGQGQSNSSLGGSGNSSLGGAGDALGGLLGPLLGAGAGAAGSGSLSGGYNKGNTKTQLTSLGDLPTPGPGSSLFGDLINTYSAGAKQAQALGNNLLFGPEGQGGGIVDALRGYQDNPVLPGEESVLNTAQEFASGEMTPDEEATQAGYRSLYENPESKYDTTAGSVYDRFATGGPNAAENEVSGLYRGFTAPDATEADLLARTKGYGGSTGQDEEKMRREFNEMIERGGYSPEEASMIRASAMLGAATPFETQEAANVNRSLAANNPLAAVIGGAQLANKKGGALSEAGRRADIDIAQERIAQKKFGLSGLGQTQAMEDARRQFGLGAEAALGRDRFGRALSGASGLADQAAKQRGYEMAGAQGAAQLGQNLFGRKATGLAGTAAGSAANRGYRMAGNKEAGDWYDRMFGRKVAGTSGLTSLYQLAQQMGLGYLNPITGMAGKPRETYTETGGQGYKVGQGG